MVGTGLGRPHCPVRMLVCCCALRSGKTLKTCPATSGSCPNARRGPGNWTLWLCEECTCWRKPLAGQPLAVRSSAARVCGMGTLTTEVANHLIVVSDRSSMLDYSQQLVAVSDPAQGGGRQRKVVWCDSAVLLLAVRWRSAGQ
jgi:hypothetical protein